MLTGNLNSLRSFIKFIDSIVLKKEYKVLANTIQITLHKSLNKVFINFLKKSIFWNISEITDLTIIDKNNKNNRYILSYFFLSEKYCNRIIVRFLVDGISYINSVSLIFKSATWLEREVFDMFGVFFKDNSDLRRILTDYGFNGYPLRKDFPVFGFMEKYYSLSENVIMNNNISLIQEFRFEQKKI